MMRNSTLCYIERGGRWLMLHRVKKENDMNRDKWLGIGGGFEEGESPFDCVVREAREETGLRLNNPEYRGLVTFVMREGGKTVTELMHLFTCSDFSGELNPDCDEGVLEWVEIEDVEKLPIWEGDRIFLGLLRTERRFFTVKLEYEGDILVKSEVRLTGIK